MRVTDDIELFMSSANPGRVLDAFSEAAVVVTRWGQIVAHNRAWRRFASAHPQFGASGGIGSQYDAVIACIARLDRQETQHLGDELKVVLGGVRYDGTFEVAARADRCAMKVRLHLPGAASDLGAIVHEFGEPSARATPDAARTDGRTARLQTTAPRNIEGMSLIDRRLRLVHWNTHFAATCGVPDELLRTGVPMAEILRAQALAGEFGPLNTSAAVDLEVTRRITALRAGSLVGVMERKRPNGGVLKLRRAALPGGGFVTLYAGVTPRKSRAKPDTSVTDQMVVDGGATGAVDRVR